MVEGERVGSSDWDPPGLPRIRASGRRARVASHPEGDSNGRATRVPARTGVDSQQLEAGRLESSLHLQLPDDRVLDRLPDLNESAR